MDQKQNKKIELKNELDIIKKETEEYKNKYLRALADYQNYEKRVRDEKDLINQNAIILLVLKFLPLLDNLDKADIFIKDQGLKMVKDSFHKILKDLGIEEIDLIEKEYDPHLAEAIEIVKGDKDNIIQEVLRKGYKFGDRVLRVAQVKVTKKS